MDEKELSGSRIEIYNSQNERTAVKPPEGYEFIGNHAMVCHGMAHCSMEFEIRPLHTPKEQRAEALKILEATNGTIYLSHGAIEAIEAIYAKYPDKEKL